MMLMVTMTHLFYAGVEEHLLKGHHCKRKPLPAGPKHRWYLARGIPTTLAAVDDDVVGAHSREFFAAAAALSHNNNNNGDDVLIQYVVENDNNFLPRVVVS